MSRELNERGAAMLLAIIVLTTLAFIALFLGSQTAVDRRMAGDEVTQAKALRCAEAGIAEALCRIANAEGPSPSGAGAARRVTQVLLTNFPGVAGADTTLLATAQPGGNWLNYSTPESGRRALTIEFHTDGARTQVMLYDKTLSPAIQPNTGMPIYRITSTGVVGAVSRTIVTEVVWEPPDVNAKAAIVGRHAITLTGSSMACGENHRADTPAGTGSGGRSGGGGCAENLGASPPRWELTTHALPGVWSAATAGLAGSATAYGTPPTVSNGTDFYAFPWDFAGMTSAQFWSWLGPPQSSMPSTPTGVTYLDNDGVTLNDSGDWTLNDGEGFLFADGNLKIKGNWRGAIYAMGDVTLTGNAWVLGTVVSNQNAMLKITGDATVLYSRDAILQYVRSTMKGGSFTTLSYVES